MLDLPSSVLCVDFNAQGFKLIDHMDLMDVLPQLCASTPQHPGSTALHARA